MVVKDCYTRYSWVYFQERIFNAADASRKYSADMHAEGAPSEGEIVRADNGGEFVGGVFGDVCKQDCIEQEFNNTKSPQFNGVAERTLGIIHGIIHSSALAARVQPHNLVLLIDIHPPQTLRTEAVHGASEPRNRTGPIHNRDIMPPHDMWYGETAF